MFQFSTITDKPRLRRLIAVLILLQTSQSTSSEPCGIRHDSSWPWHVQLVDTDPIHRTVLCDGTLLSNQLIITAAHCLHDRNGDPIELDRLLILLANDDLIAVMSTHYPKPYDPERLDHDVALVALYWKVLFSRLVGPACYADLIDFKDVRNPAFGNHTLPAQNEADCWQTTKKLFNMTYEEAICLGVFNQSHKYNENTGSGLVIESGSSWTLVGVLMYTTGQSTMDQIEYAGGVRIERYKTWITRIINHYSEPDFVNQKCKQYTSDEQISTLYSVHIMNEPFAGFCNGAIISPRFVVTTAECAKKTKHVMVNFGNSFKRESLDGIKIYYDDWNNKVALMELERDISSPGSVISCLWNGKGVQNFTNVLAFHSRSLAEQYVNQENVQYRPGFPLQIRYRCPAHLQHFWVKTFCDLIGVNVLNEQQPRIVGLLDEMPPCEAFDRLHNRQRTFEAINLQQYLPWIVDIVWRGGSG